MIRVDEPQRERCGAAQAAQSPVPLAALRGTRAARTGRSSRRTSRCARSDSRSAASAYGEAACATARTTRSGFAMRAAAGRGVDDRRESVAADHRHRERGAIGRNDRASVAAPVRRDVRRARLAPEAMRLDRGARAMPAKCSARGPAAWTQARSSPSGTKTRTASTTGSSTRIVRSRAVSTACVDSRDAAVRYANGFEHVGLAAHDRIQSIRGVAWHARCIRSRVGAAAKQRTAREPRPAAYTGGKCPSPHRRRPPQPTPAAIDANRRGVCCVRKDAA